MKKEDANNMGVLLLEKIDANDIARRIKEGAQRATNEEELRIYFAELFNIMVGSG